MKTVIFFTKNNDFFSRVYDNNIKSILKRQKTNIFTRPKNVKVIVGCEQ